MNKILQALGFDKAAKPSGKLSQKELLKMASNIQRSAEKIGFGEEIKQWVSAVTGYSSQYDESRLETFNILPCSI